jgi:hypothetical protein
MRQIELIRALDQLEKMQRHVIASKRFAKLFPSDSKQSYEMGITRAVRNGLLVRGAYGVLVNPRSRYFGQYTLEWIARSMRPADISYVSLETVLSQHGVISQIMIDRITIMTTGRSGEIKTQYGVIEFTHTKRSFLDIVASTYEIDGQPLKIATVKTALRDLRRVGRNMHLVDLSVFDEIMDYQKS